MTITCTPEQPGMLLKSSITEGPQNKVVVEGETVEVGLFNSMQADYLVLDYGDGGHLVGRVDSLTGGEQRMLFDQQEWTPRSGKIHFSAEKSLKK